MEFGSQLPQILSSLPGEGSRSWVDRLAARECPAITARRSRRAVMLGEGTDDPVVWSRARGANVEDVDGNIFVDLTAGFGVASVGQSRRSVLSDHAQNLITSFVSLHRDCANCFEYNLLQLRQNAN